MPVSGAAAELFWGFMTNFVIRQALVNNIDALASLFDEYRQFYAQPSAVAAAAEYARAVGAGRLQLSTAVTNTRAQALYEANGWVRDAAFYTDDLSV